MLAHADAQVARRDPAVPGMALALDAEVLAERLRLTRPFEGLASAQAVYVRYKPGTSCLVGYRLELPGGSTPAFAKAYRRADGAKLAKARDKAGSGLVATFDDERLVVAGVAGDRDLALPGRLARPRARRALLRRLGLPDNPGGEDVSLECLRYKPERRWVGMVRSASGPVALVKGYRERDLGRACAGLEFAMSTPLATPRLLGRSTGAAALASSWVTGQPLSDVLSRPPGGATSLAETGEALGVLHRQRGGRLGPGSAGRDLAAVTAAAAAIGAVVPRLARSASSLGEALGGRLLERPVVTSARHGDFSPDQVVLGDSGPAILDFDNAAVGDPAADLGHFLASLEVIALDGRLAAGSACSLAAQLLAGYESAGGPAQHDRVDLHRAAGLVRLAVEPFRRRQPEWSAKTEALLDRAAAVAGRAPSRS